MRQLQQVMTSVSSPADRFAEGDFRIGRVISRAGSVFVRNFFKLVPVMAIASLPTFYLGPVAELTFGVPADRFQHLGGALLGLFVGVLAPLLHATVLCGAYQGLRERPVRLFECFQIGFFRFFPLMGLLLCMGGLVVMAAAPFIVIAIRAYAMRSSATFFWIGVATVPVLMLLMMWFVATPLCMIEQLGPFRSMGRSRQLTKGHRWQIFGLLLLLVLPAAAGFGVIRVVVVGMASMVSMASSVALANLIWGAVWKAFFVVLTVVIYDELRVAKEGANPHQIATVFE